MKWYTYLICFVLIVVGTFCGIEVKGNGTENEDYFYLISVISIGCVMFLIFIIAVSILGGMIWKKTRKDNEYQLIP